MRKIPAQSWCWCSQTFARSFAVVSNARAKMCMEQTGRGCVGEPETTGGAGGMRRWHRWRRSSHQQQPAKDFRAGKHTQRQLQALFASEARRKGLVKGAEEVFSV
jgi:hypothetical protein